MKIFCLFFFILMNATGFSQLVVTHYYYGPHPTELNTPAALKQNKILAEEIYRYKKEKNNKDSFLVTVNFFDSLGNCIKKEEFKDADSMPYEITNYTFLDGLLVREEITSTNATNTTTTYEYDSAGNRIDKKIYYRNSRTKTVPQMRWEYDGVGRVIKEYSYADENSLSAYTVYHYNGYDYNGYGWDNGLTEKRQFDSSGSWNFSYQYAYDYEQRKKLEYFANKHTRYLEWEYYYSSDNLLIKKMDEGNVLYEFTYKDGLLFSEKARQQTLMTTYFKHYYFLYQW